MKKEKILEKVIQSDIDEDIEYAENRKHELGNIFLLTFSLLLLIFSFILKSDAFYAVAALSFAYSAVQKFENYLSEKKKITLFQFILDGVLSISGLVIFIVAMLKK